MKTAMQELIEKLHARCDFCLEKELISEWGTLRMTIIEAQSLLEKEKYQIQKAFSDGQETPINHPTLPHYSREEYYDDNYKPETI
jgi:hypothetical protein